MITCVHLFSFIYNSIGCFNILLAIGYIYLLIVLPNASVLANSILSVANTDNIHVYIPANAQWNFSGDLQCDKNNNSFLEINSFLDICKTSGILSLFSSTKSSISFNFSKFKYSSYKIFKQSFVYW